MKFGIIGRNFVTDWMMAAIAATPETEAVAVYSRSLEGAREFAGKYHLSLTFDNIEEMAASPAIDAVYIASPNYAHFEQAKAFLSHGKHVLCEKPATLTARETLELLSIAKAHNVIFLEAMRTLFDDVPDLIRSALPRIGTLRKVRFEYSKYSSRYDRFLRGEPVNAFDPDLQNSAMRDLGCYAVSVIIDLFGAPRSFSASSFFLDNGFEGGGSILMNYGSFLADASYGKVYDAPYSYLSGEKGRIIIREFAEDKPQITLSLRDGTNTAIPYEQKLPNSMTRELAVFCRMAKGEESPDRFNQITIDTLKVMDAAREESRNS